MRCTGLSTTETRFNVLDGPVTGLVRCETWIFSASPKKLMVTQILKRPCLEVRSTYCQCSYPQHSWSFLRAQSHLTSVWKWCMAWTFIRNKVQHIDHRLIFLGVCDKFTDIFLSTLSYMLDQVGKYSGTLYYFTQQFIFLLQKKLSVRANIFETI